MLGELVANEIRELKHEKECGCVSCLVRSTLRQINLFTLQATCECPVCTEARRQLRVHGENLDRLMQAYFEERKKVEPMLNSTIYVAENEDRIRCLAAHEGAVIIAAKITAATVNGFKHLLAAAHDAYDEIERATLAGYADSLTGVLRKVRDFREAGIATALGRKTKPEDVN